MAIGSTYEQSNDKLFILKIKTKTLDKDTQKEIPALPHVFQVLEKVDGKWVAQEAYQNQFTGNLTKIDFSTGEWEKTVYHVVKLTFRDPEKQEPYILDCRMSSDFRSLANSILSLDPGDLTDLKVRTYKKKGKTGDKEYSNIGLFQHDELVMGKYAWADMPAVEKVKFKGQEMSDTSKLDDWTIARLKEFAASMASVVKDNNQEEELAGVGSEADISGSDIPF